MNLLTLSAYCMNSVAATKGVRSWTICSRGMDPLLYNHIYFPALPSFHSSAYPQKYDMNAVSLLDYGQWEAVRHVSLGCKWAYDWQETKPGILYGHSERTTTSESVSPIIWLKNNRFCVRIYHLNYSMYLHIYNVFIPCNQMGPTVWVWYQQVLVNAPQDKNERPEGVNKLVSESVHERAVPQSWLKLIISWCSIQVHWLPIFGKLDLGNATISRCKIILTKVC